MHRKLILAAAGFLLCGNIAFAQAVTSSIVGTVRDSTGGVVAGVRLKVINTETDTVREVVADESGNYLAASLLPGRYRIEASEPAFQTAVVTGLVLDMDRRVRVDIKMEVGQVNQQVVVEAASILIGSENAEVGQVIHESQIKNLPLNGRNFLQLAKLSPGVTPSFGRRGTSEAASFSDGRKDLTMHVGGRGDSASFLIDGVESRSKVGGFVAVPISIDAIQEFNVKRNNFNAQYGFGEATVSVTTKSGANQLHGTIYEFLRNDALDARNFFEARKAPFRENQFGFAVGGPIRKDKTFFFGNYEGFRVRRQETFVVSVPAPEHLKGNFAGEAPVIDPGSGLPFPNNVIPEPRISTWAKVFRDLYPAPNRSTFPNLNTTNRYTRDQDQFTTRVDHNFSPKDQLYGRFIFADDDQLRPEFVQLKTGNISPLHSRNLAIHETHVFSPTWVNVATFGYSHILRDTVREPFDRDLTQQLGLRNPGQEVFRVPVNDILGFNAFGGTGFGFGEKENTFQFATNSTIIKGPHSLNFGGELRQHSVASTIIQSTSGTVSFDRSFTNNAVANFLLGLPRTISKASGVNTNTFKWKEYALYLQDDWKIRPTLTLNLGLRWSVQQPITEIDAKTQSFDLVRGVLVISRPLKDGGIDFAVPGIEERLNPQPRSRHYRDFEPRFGFAWRPFGSSSTVVRGGYGIFYTLTGFLEQRQSATQEPPFFVLQSLQSSPTTPELSTTRLWPSAADGLRIPGSINIQAVFDPSDKDPYMHEWNFGVERRFKDWVGEASYVGKAGVHVGLRHNVNDPVPSPEPRPELRRPYPLFGPILGRFQKQNTSYNALQTRLQRQFGHGFSFLGSYTWAHAIDLESREPSSAVVQDFRNIRGSRGNSAYDVRHRFVASGLYELPLGKGKKFLNNSKGFTSKLVGGWQTNGIVSLSTGNKHFVRVSQDRANVGAGFRNVRPDVTRNPNLPRGERTPERWFDTSAFQLQPFGQWGNSGRNILTAPGQNVVDFSLFKNNFIGERFNVQIRAEFFNAFNHPNFETPQDVIDGPNFGRVTGADRPREIQFGIKVIF